MTSDVVVKDELRKSLQEKFASVTVSQSALARAEEMFRSQPINSFEEKMIHDITRGVPKDKLGAFGNSLSRVLGLNDEQKEELAARLDIMDYADSSESDVFEFKLDNDQFQSMYGFVSMMQQNNDKVAIAYAVHKVKFSLPQKAVNHKTTTTKKTKFLFWNLGEVQYHKNEIRYQSTMKISGDDREMLKDVYGRFKALDTLRKEGIISQINFEP